MAKLSSITVTGISEETKQFILKIQWELKQKRSSGQVHQGKAVIHIVNEYKKLIEKQ